MPYLFQVFYFFIFFFLVLSFGSIIGSIILLAILFEKNSTFYFRLVLPTQRFTDLLIKHLLIS